MEMTKQEAMKALSDKVSEFNKALMEAEAIADKYMLNFSIEPAYGMGGTYEGDGYDEDGNEVIDRWSGNSEHGWQPSSQSC